MQKSDQIEISIAVPPHVAALELAREFGAARVWRQRARNLPWWVISALFHFLVIALCSLITMSFNVKESSDSIIITTRFQTCPEEVEAKEAHAAKTAAVASPETPATDPFSVLNSQITVPEDVRSAAELRERFETVNPDRPDTESSLGVPDARIFADRHGNDHPAGGGGTDGADLNTVIGFGGAPTRGKGGGWGGGTGAGAGLNNGKGDGSFGQRNGAGREFLVKRHGGSPATEAAVHRALAWLARHQSPAGNWNIQKYQSSSVQGYVSNDECISPLAVLAFLGAGHTPIGGEFKDSVRRGVDWIISRQKSDGSLRTPCFNYGESLSTLALCEAYGMSGDKRIGAAAQLGIDYLVSVQEYDGGWSHSGTKSTSVTGWVVMALKSGKICGLRVPQKAFERATAYLTGVTEKDSAGYFGRVGYNRLGDCAYNQGYTMTAVGMASFQYLGCGPETEHQAEMLMRAVPIWKNEADYTGPPQNFYHWYYGTLALFQYGGESWNRWNEALQKALLPNQRIPPVKVAPEKKEPVEQGEMSGIRSVIVELPRSDSEVEDLDGSWDPVTTWDAAGGRVYSTAMGALCLEVYYRYLKLSPKN